LVKFNHECKLKHVGKEKKQYMDWKFRTLVTTDMQIQKRAEAASLVAKVTQKQTTSQQVH